MLIEILRSCLTIVVKLSDGFGIWVSLEALHWLWVAFLYRLRACSKKTSGSTISSLLWLRSRWEGFIIQKCQNSFLTQKNFKNFFFLSPGEILVLVNSLDFATVAASDSWHLLIIMHFSFTSLLLDFVLDIVHTLPQNFLKWVLLIDFSRKESFNLSQKFFLSCQNFFESVNKVLKFSELGIRIDWVCANSSCTKVEIGEISSRDSRVYTCEWSTCSSHWSADFCGSIRSFVQNSSFLAQITNFFLFTLLKIFCLFISFLSLDYFISLLLKLKMLFPQLCALFFMKHHLSQQKLSIILLAKKLYLKFLMLLCQNPIIIINLLSNLCHCLKMLGQFFLFLLVVILVFIFLFSLFLEFIFYFSNSGVKRFPNLLTFQLKDLAHEFLNIFDFIVTSIIILIYVLNILICLTFNYVGIGVFDLF